MNLQDEMTMGLIAQSHSAALAASAATALKDLDKSWGEYQRDVFRITGRYKPSVWIIRGDGRHPCDQFAAITITSGAGGASGGWNCRSVHPSLIGPAGHQAVMP